jgi:hypothetical protein
MKDNLTPQQRYYRKNKDRINAKSKAKRQNPEQREKNRRLCRKYYTDNRVEILEEKKQQRSRLSQPQLEAAREKCSAYAKKNADAIRDRLRAYNAARRATDLGYYLKHRLSNRIRIAIKKGKGFKDNSTTDLLGCSVDDVRLHLESHFTDGMTWENHGVHGWHIDHIKPCASFDLTLDSEQKKCFHYSNLQPLWAEDNLRKSDKY